MSSPLFAITLSSSASAAIPPPLPPRVKAGLTITGYPIFAATESASSMVFAISEGTTGCPIDSMVSLNSSLSSALSMASTGEPRSLTLYLSRTPAFLSCMAMVRPVWPPRPARSPSGFSFAMIRSTVSAFNGSRYISSARSLSVMIVAGLEFTSTTLMPSSLKTRHAWAPA